jgi:hypothetical protein
LEENRGIFMNENRELASLASRPPRTLSCDENGVFIWPGFALVERRGKTFVRASERDIGNFVGVLHGPDAVYGPLISMLDRAARLLESGKVDQTKAIFAKLKLPPLTASGETMLRAGSGSFDSDTTSALADRFAGSHGRTI